MSDEQIASALDYAHACGFVHRDIKPSNVIVADDGWATLTDFGLVKAGEGSKLTTTGVTFGTAEYLTIGTTTSGFVAPGVLNKFTALFGSPDRPILIQFY